MVQSKVDLMLVTVISVAFNSEQTIGRTIESILGQTYKEIEYIIVDGASTDKTVSVAKSYLDRFNSVEGRKMTIISEPDNGMYDALNKGIKMASGELIGSINTDDWYELDAVEKMVDFYKKEKYDAAWGDLRIIKKGGNMIKHAKLGKLWTTTGWCHPSMFATKEILMEYPYACETMYDDFDFITRVHLAGKKICVLSETIANFTFGDGGMSTKKSLSDAFKRVNITYGIYRKHGMSRFYWFHRVALEMAKFILS